MVDDFKVNKRITRTSSEFRWVNFVLVLLALFFLLGSATITFRHFQFGYSAQQKQTSNSQTAVNINHQMAQSEVVSSTVSKYGVPKRIIIPKIQIDASVESVGMDAQGRMDVPRFVNETAWYNLGYKPGENGNAVIDGHLDTTTGAPAVFYNLSSLEPGDKITIVDENGKNLNFIVERKEIYAYNQIPMQEVFGANDYPRLNLITCTGWFNQQTKNYSNRVVIYSKLQ